MMMNPIFESSARRRMRSVRLPAIVTAYALAMLILSVCQLTVFFADGMVIWGMRKSTECYIWMTALQFFLILLVAPALSAGSIAGERERQTFDLLLVTGVGVRRIVMGKMMENFAALALVIFAGMPVMALSWVTGALPVAAMLETLLFLLVIAFAALAVGMLASVLMRRSLAAILTAYMMIFAIGAGTWILAKRGPIAAAYDSDVWQTIKAAGGGWAAIRTMPPTIFFNAAVALVMLLAGQTGILHRTMEYTMRLYDIYFAAGHAGFMRAAWVSIGTIFASAILVIALCVLILHMRTGRIGARAKRKG